MAQLGAERQEHSLSQSIPSNDKYKHFMETYEDLTGMFVTDVKQTNDGYTYNCIQNGSHGSKYLLSTCKQRKLIIDIFCVYLHSYSI